MARSSNQGGRFPRRKPDGDAAPQPVQTGAEPCSSDGEAWSESLRLLDELRKLRGIMRVRVDEEYAESLVAHHLRRVRASRWNVGLYRVMRLGRLDGERFVLVLYVLAAYYGHLFIPSLRDALALAAGFHPVRVRTLGIWATQEGRLFRFDEQGKIHPSQTLVEMASGAAPISDQEAEWFHEVLAKWPTKERHNE